MKEFPSHLKPANKERFPKYCYDRNLAYLRKEVFELVLLGDENSYFELDNFSRKYKLKKGEIEQMRDIIMRELKVLGWNVKTSFGGTGLFVYSTTSPPPSCYEDEF
jgi:hypothetical protein